MLRWFDILLFLIVIVDIILFFFLLLNNRRLIIRLPLILIIAPRHQLSPTEHRFLAVLISFMWCEWWCHWFFQWWSSTKLRMIPRRIVTMLQIVIEFLLLMLSNINGAIVTVVYLVRVETQRFFFSGWDKIGCVV